MEEAICRSATPTLGTAIMIAITEKDDDDFQGIIFIYTVYTYIFKTFSRLKILVDEERMPPFEAIFKIGLSSLSSRLGQYNNKSWPRAVSVCVRTSRKQKARGIQKVQLWKCAPYMIHILNCIAKKPSCFRKHRKNCECCPGHYLSTSVY